MLTDRIRALAATQVVNSGQATTNTAPGVGRAADPFQIAPGGASEVRREIVARERAQRRLLVVADAVSALTAFALAAVLTSAQPTWLCALVAFVVIAAAKLQGIYDCDELVIRPSTLQETPKLLELAAVTGVIIYFARDALLSGHSGSPGFFCLVALLLAFLMFVGRTFARALARRVVTAQHCLVAGDAAVLRVLQQRMVDVKGARLVGAVPTDELPRSASGLQAMAAHLHAHRIIIAPEPQMDENQIADLISFARAAGLRVSMSPGVMAAFGGGRAVDQFGGYTIVGVPHFGLSRSSAAIKRAFDVLAAMVAIVAFAPLIIAAAVWIKLDAPGPVLFRQTRVGRDGRHFCIWKLRSMVEGAEAMKLDLLHLNEAAGGLFKIAADPRVTPSGHWLRRTRMDELPQLFNVLRGEMSLVGPRPLVIEEDEQIVGRDRRRLHLMPGITGPWQILGRRSHVLPIDEMAKLDYMYVANWSLWEDICILLRTVGLVAGRGGV
ncbi:MAG TPA: exopolysaccharide biosynthesis polyprenyl glycosylphosphotransferase [Solirubrobacteraceae bacterium]|nr:exopolysaccharide biosynthesis polyprenyl glycosylphosphotransferase [Solirubrobacteraceae bacterium]